MLQALLREFQQDSIQFHASFVDVHETLKPKTLSSCAAMLAEEAMEGSTRILLNLFSWMPFPLCASTQQLNTKGLGNTTVAFSFSV